MGIDKILASIWLIWAAIPLILGIVSCLLSFWSRGRVELKLFWKFQEFKVKFLGSKRQWDWDNLILVYLLFDVIIAGFLLSIVGCLWFQLGIISLIALGSLITFIVLPRYIGDIFNTLKYCFKTKDSKRLLELEAKVEALSK